MKKWIWMVILLVFLAACSGASGQETAEDDSNGDQKVKNEQKEEKKENETEETPEGEEEEESETATAPAVKEPQYQLTGNWTFEPINDSNPKVALITIDDAPDQYSVEMAKTLKELNAPAIFFVNGHFLDTEEEKEKLRKIHEMGFAIGNHTYNHSSLPDLSQEEQRKEITDVNNLVEEIIGERPKFFRAPFGQNTEFSKQLAAEEGMLVMNWSYGYDWNKEYMDSEKLADIMVNTNLLNDGANLLMHDREWTYKALPEIVKGLREKGYELLDPDLIKVP